LLELVVCLPNSNRENAGRPVWPYVKSAKLLVIIQTDIKSFYTRIIRDSLVQFSSDQLSRSERVEWLLRILFARDIDDHEAGKGIVQGNIASGFFANLYLIDLDARFGPANEWNVEFFRYVDDMIIVVPDPEDAERVLTELERELAKIGLELNRDKTERFTNIADFIGTTNRDEALDNLQTQFQNWLNCLWILDQQHRQVFRKAYRESQAEWWYRVELYVKCLSAIGIHIGATLLSRRIYKYLFNDKLCEQDFVWEGSFEIPTFPDDMQEKHVDSWKTAFCSTNSSWIDKQKEFHDSLQELLRNSKQQLDEAINNGDIGREKQWARTLRFCINKLIQVEFQSEDIIQIILDVLLKTPWLIRNSRDLIENLAIRGYTDHIKLLLMHYNDENEMNEYMRSIVMRAIRFLPTLPDEVWEEVVNGAISSSNVVSLMATETWLKVSQSQPQLVKEAALKRIETALSKNPKPILRLRKNYLLMLGKHKQELSIQIEDKQDALIQNVRDIIQADEINSLFSYYEPEILAREFYSGYRTEEGFYHPSSP